MKFAHQERRLFKRVPFIRNVEIIGIGIFRCLNLSTCGLYLEIEKAFPEGSFVDLRFKLRDIHEQPLTIQACVLHEQEGKGVGLVFIDLSLEDHEKIVEFVKEVGIESVH